MDRSRLGRAAREALAVVFPVECAGCGRTDAPVCSECLAAMTGPVEHRDLDPGFPVWAGTSYSGPARRAILALKNDQRTDVARALAGVLRPAISAAVADGESRGAVHAGLLLATVPSSRAAYRRRGYRPVDAVVKRTGLEFCRPLAIASQPLDQIGLGIAAREANIAGALRSRRARDDRLFLLVDDVVTTGGTLREARRALVEAGGSVVGAAVIAATPRHSPPGR
ncbi:MAG: phosphoribosyltransferase family protein [Mycetocola sp.]